jgi:hypothetical protein
MLPFYCPLFVVKLRLLSDYLTNAVVCYPVKGKH